MKGKAKGHRQRGAGTVIVSPPPITTEDGIKLAPHMRLPSILLQEYCQKEKLPKPLYELCESEIKGKFRMRLTILNHKDRRKDLHFLPTDSCTSEKMARDYSALLALFHFQRTLPLERKLPEPFRTTWIDLTCNGETDSLQNLALVSPNITADQPLIQLRSEYEFSSIADKEAHERKRITAEKENADKHYAEVLINQEFYSNCFTKQLLAANRVQIVEMTPKMRKYLIDTCQLTHTTYGISFFSSLNVAGSQSSISDLANEFRDRYANFSLLRNVYEELFPETLNDEIDFTDILLIVYEKVVTDMLKLGYERNEIKEAFCLALQYLTTSYADLNYTNLRLFVLEGLCLTVNESRLLNVSGAFVVIHSSILDIGSSYPGEYTTTTSLRSSPHI